VVHLIGMESPALTSAGAIAEYVMPMIHEILN
jgi:L-2-hydroxyglutarate oxidase LhgO